MSVSINLFRQSEDTVPFNRGQVIFRQGQHGALMYAVISGEVDIVVDGLVVDTVQSGGILGEMALIDQGPRSATAIARTDCTLALITEKHFAFLIQQTPFFALQVMRVMADRLRSRNQAVA